MEPVESQRKSNRKRKKADEVDEMDRAIFDKIMNSKKTDPLAQMVDDTVTKFAELGLKTEALQFRRAIINVIYEFEEKLL